MYMPAYPAVALPIPKRSAPVVGLARPTPTNPGTVYNVFATFK